MLRLFLKAYPKAFREKYGEDMLQTYRDVYGPRSVRAAADMLWNGLLARAGRAPGDFEEWLQRPAREGRGERVLSQVWQDLRYGVRSLQQARGFTLAILLTLALGIGANTAIFSVVDAVLLRPLPYANGARLVHVLQPAQNAGVENVGFSPLEVADLREQAHSLDAVVEYHSMAFTLLGGSEPQRVQTGVVSSGFFDAFGVRPWLGRTFQPADDQLGAVPVLLLSYEYWQKTYRGDPALVGKTFTMNDKVHTVVGILPPMPQYPGVNDVYMPVSACPFRSTAPWLTTRKARGLTVFGRLKPGATLQQTRADLAGVADRLHQAYPADYPAAQGYTASAALLSEELTRKARPTLVVLLFTAIFLLIIVCANVANLTLARLVKREREMAVRTALGATRLRLFRQLLTEGLLLASAGGALGVLVAVWGRSALVAFVGRFTTRNAEIAIDHRVLLFAVGLSLATGVVLGCLPALPARHSLAADLKDGSGSTSRKGSLRARSVLIVAQVAVSFTLLIGAGLMLRSLLKLQEVHAGFDPENVLTARVDLNWTKYDKPEKVRAFVEPFLARLREAPGVVSVAVANTFPLNGPLGFTPPFRVEGRTVDPAQPQPKADYRTGSPDYFRTMGIPLLRGRVFTDNDKPPAPDVAVLNQSAAKHLFPGEDPLGKRITFDDGKTWTGIVGIVADVKQNGLETEAVDEVYQTFGFSTWRDLKVVVRAKSLPLQLERTVREAVREFDAQQPITGVRTLEDVRSESLAPPRLTALLLGAFALLALVITAAGIAGVIAYSVSQRTHEIGIRMALGAQRGEVLGMVLRQGMTLLGAGLGLGVLGGVVLARTMQGLVFGVPASDPITFVGGLLLLALVGALSCLIPARRATEVDPMVALRSA